MGRQATNPKRCPTRLWPLLPWALPAPAATRGPIAGPERGVPGSGRLRNSTFWPSSGASSCHLPGVPLSPVYHANFSRDNFSTMSPPARTEPLYGAGPREAAALPRRTKAHCSANMPAPLRPESAEHAASGPAERTPGRPPPGARSSHPSRREGGPRKAPEATWAGRPLAGRRGLAGSARVCGDIEAPELEHLIRLISSRTNVPPRGEGFWAPKLFCD